MLDGFKRFDSWLIEKPYQNVVDLSGKKPAWWVEQCGFALLVFGAARFILDDESNHSFPDYLVLFMNMLMAGVLYFFSRMPSMLKQLMSDIKIRMFLVLFFPIVVSSALALPWMAGVAKIIAEFAFLSAYYFAACNDPKPRERKRQLVTA